MSGRGHVEDIRLVISDVDGTLTRGDKTLSECTIAAVKRLRAADIGFSLISARPPSGLLWIAERLGLERPIAAFNGGIILQPDGEVLETHRLSRALAERALALVDKPEAMVWVFAEGIWHTRTTDADHTPREVKSAGQQPTIVKDFAALLGAVDKIVAVSDDPAFLQPLEKQVAEAIGGEANVACSQTYYLDITAGRANKGDGVAGCCQSDRNLSPFGAGGAG